MQNIYTPEFMPPGGIVRKPLAPPGIVLPGSEVYPPPPTGDPIAKGPQPISKIGQPGEPDGPTSGPVGNPQGPRDRPGGGAPPTINQPGGISQDPSRPTPSMPASPTPVASEPPRPFTPMDPTMTPPETTQPTGITRRTVPGSPSMQSPNLLGSAGGLLGGGLGVPGQAGGTDPQSLADAIYQIMLLKNGGSGGSY